MRAFLSLLKSNFKMTLRNRTGLFWLLFFPAFFIVVFGYLVGGDSRLSSTVGVVNGDATPVSQRLVAALEDSGAFEVRRGGRKEELEKLRAGRLDAVLIFPEEMNPDGALRVEAYVDRSQQGTAQAALTGIQQTVDRFNERASGGPEARLIALQSRSVAGEDAKFIDILVPGILAFSIMNSGLFGLSGAFVSLRERGVLRRIKLTPVSLASFVAARVLVQLVVALAQVVILIGMAEVLFDLRIVGSLFHVALFSVLGALVFQTVGFFVAGVSATVDNANALSNLIGFPMLFLGGVFFPLDAAPEWVQFVARALPLTYLVDGLRQIMVYGASLESVGTDAAVLLLTAAVGLVLAARFFRWESKAA